MGEDTRQPSPPPGWGVFERNGLQVGKLTPTYFSAFGEPYGCAFGPDPDPDDGVLPPLFTTDVGTESIGGADGQLIVWFPPYDQFPGRPAYPETDERSCSYCKIASDIGTAAGSGDRRRGRISGLGERLQILRSPPSRRRRRRRRLRAPTTSARRGQLRADVRRRGPPNGMAFFTGSPSARTEPVRGERRHRHIGEYDLDGNLLPLVVDPAGDPFCFRRRRGNPRHRPSTRRHVLLRRPRSRGHSLHGRHRRQRKIGACASRRGPGRRDK
jgi:hypothetical protein